MSTGSDKTTLDNCGCCETDSTDYPEHYNRPGQAAIRYRLNTHSGFVERMLARLSRDQIVNSEDLLLLEEQTGATNKRPLAKLGTRREDDPSIAMLDAWAVVADVLTFYQERIANEGYIRTAIERRSVLELAHAIGYELNPGVAASTWLAFNADNSPGSPLSATVPVGTQVLSIPGKDELPQTFETIEEIIARADWNALKPYTLIKNVKDSVEAGITAYRLDGVGLGLKAGDGLLFVGDKKIAAPESEFWDFRILTEVSQSDDNKFTLVKWDRGLGHIDPDVEPASANVKIYSFNTVSSLFGKNAADWDLLPYATKADYVEKILGSVSGISVAVNGSRLVFAGSNKILNVWTRVWNNKTKAYYWSKDAIDVDAAGDGVVGQISSVAVSKSGSDSIVILGHADGALSKVTKSGSVWIRNPIPASVRAHDDEITNTAFSPNADSFVSIDINKIIQVWDAGDGFKLARFIPQTTTSHNGKKYRLGSDQQALVLWTFTSTWSPEPVNEQAHDDIVTSMAINRDAKMLLSGGADGTLKFWKKGDNGWLGHEFRDTPDGPAHSGPVIAVAFPASTLNSGIVISSDVYDFKVYSQSINGISRAWNVNIVKDTGVVTLTLLQTFDNDTIDYLTEWPDYDLIFNPAAPTVLLHDHFPGIVKDSWVVLDKPTYTELYRVEQAKKVWHEQFNIAGDVSSLSLDNSEHLNWFGRRDTSVYVQSKELAPYAEQVPDKHPVEADRIELDQLTPQLEAERMVVVAGKRMRALIKNNNLPNDEKKKIKLTSLDTLSEKDLDVDDILLAMSRPVAVKTDKNTENDPATLSWETTPEGFIAKIDQENVRVKWHLKNRNGFVGYVTVNPEQILLIPAREEEKNAQAKEAVLKEDEQVSELVMIKQLEEERHDDLLLVNTVLEFTTPLVNIYDHDTVTINANVAPATHGETVLSEVMGSGDGTQINQQFTLRKIPLTYVSAPTPSGGESTLEVRVNGVLWKQVDSLYQQGPRDQVYTIRHDDDSNAIITFGDGKQGARLPTGHENIKATYRNGIGLDGEVRAETLKLLKSKPLGIREVRNPLAASGAASPEVLADARDNAPLTVLTLDRIVSVDDFEDFAAAFAGIGKAQATVLWNGAVNIVHITIATASGGTVSDTDAVYANLLTALDRVRDTTVQVQVAGYTEVHFTVEAKLLIDPGYIKEKVMAEVKEALWDAFSFAKRKFGQGVNEAEVLTVITGVEGVLAADLTGDKLAVVEEKIELETFDNVLNMKYLRANKADWEDKTKRIIILPAHLLLISTSNDGIILSEMAS
ncbi:MAG: putative baseplate assembly protein [Gammaproteobacteria bacterium]|nr:putative baseplate assembly protein [Gammaproteobacteria bacterium]MDH5651344.1 putative baseplate assembly protein [Gammaproteobacteria bacterium]